MPIVAMHRYGTETLSTTPIDHHHHHHHHQPQQQHHHQHHQQQINEQQQVLTRHLEEQQQQRHDEDQEDVDRVSGITAVMRGTRAEFNLNVLFPNMPSQNTSDSSGSTNSHHGHHQQHLEEVLHDDTYLQIRASTGTGEGVSPVPVRTGSSPGSSRSPHEDQQQQQQALSSPNRHNDTSNTYSPAQEPPRLQSFTHLTAMQPTVVSVNHLQDERVQSEQLYIDSIYAHHQQSTSHHHQEHEQSSTTSHSPTGPRRECR
ncbi:PREDICTED: involucrin-like [Ceratosolen solmsi marchali]|uniref:Involucrin-like n=1 Tax=Ceratosolen solmsi marchali TaxID=326594 RepID=A0AAJ6YFT9_9HYME|nr:PREDICTED: involucrin-like [Ceratosolen solmsi marchali]